jgi:hypothetical protein
MTLRPVLRYTLISMVMVACAVVHPTYTSASHARIIRLSLVQGDVRVLHDSKGDPLANDKAPWERAELNLPIRQHDVIATDHGRAEIEFENGSMAFLSENSVLEFFDLSLDDGSLTTRLVLRQGSASFYANPSSIDYFSVTGGDFTAEAGPRANFRMGNFDDGSTVAVNKGRVVVVHKDKTDMLEKGQSLTMHAGDEKSVSIGRAPEGDDFDHWVSGREDSVVTATNAALQYTNSTSSSYASGYADLYTYGGFYPVSGYGYGWQPYGAGVGWSPFSFGNWYYGSGFGWSFIGNQPWGWLPYHYGGWLFQPGMGWLWVPNAAGGRGSSAVNFHPATATFVRSGETVAIVPTHPLDKGNKMPLNLAHGVMPLNSKNVSAEAAASSKWTVLKTAPAETMVSHASSTTAPARIGRTLQAAGSSIAYDAAEHRFVNSNTPARSAVIASEAAAAGTSSRTSAPTASTASARAAASTRSTVTMARSASARVAAPPSVPRGFISSSSGFSPGAATSRGSTVSMGTATRSSAASSHPSSGGGRAH